MVCAHNRDVPCLWIGAGTFMRGIWDGYPGVVRALVRRRPSYPSISLPYLSPSVSLLASLCLSTPPVWWRSLICVPACCVQMAEHPNLYVSFTPELVSGKYDGLSRREALRLAKELPHRIVSAQCCTSTCGTNQLHPFAIQLHFAPFRSTSLHFAPSPLHPLPSLATPFSLPVHPPRRVCGAACSLASCAALGFRSSVPRRAASSRASPRAFSGR